MSVKHLSAVFAMTALTGCATVPFSADECSDQVHFMGGMFSKKSYNETCARDRLIEQTRKIGHETGDEGLIAVGQILHEKADPAAKRAADEARELLLTPKTADCQVTGVRRTEDGRMILTVGKCAENIAPR